MVFAFLISLAVPRVTPLEFKIGTTAFTASLSEFGGGGLLWIRSNPIAGRSVEFTDVSEDQAFKPGSLTLFTVKGQPNARVIVAEFFEANWGRIWTYLVTENRIAFVVGFSHRDSEALKLKRDKAGNLIELQFTDRWCGYPPNQHRDPAPGKRWAFVTTYRPSAMIPWLPVKSHWTSVPH